MSMAFPIIFIIGSMFACAIALYAILMHEQKRKQRASQGDLAKKAKAYTFLSENFLTRKTFRKLVEQLASLSIYNLLEIRTLAIQYYTQTLGLSLVLVFVGIIVFRDVTAVLLCIVFALVIYLSLITKKVDTTHFLVLKEFSATLSSIRESYTLMGNIPDAINECTKGKFLQKSMDKIYLILTATDSEERLEEFYRTVPFPMLQTLAGVCYLLNDAGDERDDRGVSAFKSAITLLKHECDLEIRKLTKQRMMFSMLEYLPLAPLPFIGVLKWFFTTYMPGTSVIYNGMIGYISQTLIILIAIFAYWYITSTNSPTAIRRNDRSDFVDAFLYWPPFQRILPNILPKKARTKLKIEKELKGALSSKDIKYIYASKVLAAGIAFVMTLTALTAFTFLAKEFTYDNIKTASFLGGSDMSVEDARKWHELDNSLLAQPKAPRERDLQDIIPSYFPDISAMDLKDQCNRILQKYNNYHALSFHWWYVLIAYGLGVFGWFAPGIMLDLRKKMVRAEEEEDVLQLQTMLAILRFTHLDTMEALYWLARQSRIYQTAIYFAYHEYPSDPELALNRLKDKSSLPEFQQICERLLSTISQVTIREAFSDLESERDQMLSIREMVQNNALERKRRQCSPISRAPLMAMVIGHVLAPIGILAFNEITNMMGQLGVM